ncbi:hypothetical protein Btru_033729 [Bulinus truncatus]|nr:hypothetical protein Btru_033729 [Bulinus truncatus]
MDGIVWFYACLINSFLDTFSSEEQNTDRTVETELSTNVLKPESVAAEPSFAQQGSEETLPSFEDISYLNASQPQPAEDLVDFTGQWHLSTDKASHKLETSPVLLPHQFSDVQLNSEQLCSDCQPNMKTARVERSAGRMPARSLSAHLPGYIRVPEVMKKAPPLRTPPSIPSPQFNLRTTERKTGQIFLELEHHARRTKSPRSFMQKVEGLRSVTSAYQPTVSSNATSESIIGTSLQVCRLPVGKKTPQLPTEFILDTTDKNITDQANLPSGWNSPSSVDMYNQYLKQKHVSFSDLQQQHKTTSAPASSPRSSLEETEMLLPKNTISIASKQSKDKLSDESTLSITTKSLAKIGRPIAQVQHITDPDDLHKASQLLREAAAAVDIQRIFRGYVARTTYKSLLSEARWKREDEQKAVLEKQRLNKEHNQRMNAIYNRAPLSPEIKQWSNDVKSVQLENALKRQEKMNSLANEMVINQKESKNKILSIGPHVEIYDIYHPKQVGPTMKEYNLAAIKIQKLVRGWMIRRKIGKLSRKATWYGSSFLKMAKEYKSMLKQVQSQHGVDKPKSPFSIREFSTYIDMRRRYESVYDKKAFSGELEVAELKSFFTECDLHPSQAEIDEALDVTTHGQAYKSENKGLKKRELLDLLFYIYVPPATGLQGTRKSTWMNPIIDGEEGRKLLGSEFIEPAPLEPCAKLVIQAKREQRQKEQALKNAEEKKRIEESLLRTEEKKQSKKSKQVVIHDPTVSN